MPPRRNTKAAIMESEVTRLQNEIAVLRDRNRTLLEARDNFANQVTQLTASQHDLQARYDCLETEVAILRSIEFGRFSQDISPAT